MQLRRTPLSLRHFKPFFNSDIYYEWVAAKLVSKGKVDLFIIRNYQLAGNKTVHSFQAGYGAISVRVEVATDENMGVERHMYLLEHSPTNFLSALPTPSEKLLETLEGFFPKKYLAKYAEVKGDITYKTVPDLVELYNSR